jgi:hypothetical protein
VGRPTPYHQSVDPVRAWLAAAPLLAAGVLVAHEVAYRLTATRTGSTHGYLEHAPQVLVALTVVGLALAALTRASRVPRLWVFPLAGLGAFALQEHVEAIAHGEQVPFLLSSPAFLLGMLLQLPFALAAWLLARALLGSLAEVRLRRPRLPRAAQAIAVPAMPDVRAVAVRPLPGRGPPALLRR